jgi:hypothetical protein
MGPLFLFEDEFTALNKLILGCETYGLSRIGSKTWYFR